MAPEPSPVSRRVSRRTFLAGGASAALVASCGGRSASETRPQPGELAGETTGPIVPTAGATAAPTPAPRRSGGTARVVAPSTLAFDTFDAQRSGEPALAEILGRTHSRIVEWAEYDPLRIGGDLATRWEQPDPETWSFHLDPRARWQPRAPLDGRPVTANDVVAHLRRAMELARTARLPAAQRQDDILRVRAVTAVDERTVRVTTDGPDPFLLHTLAARLAFVQAPDAVEAFAKTWHLQRPAEVVGSGPFLYTGANERTTAAFAAHMQGHRPPALDGLELEPAAGSRAMLLSGGSDEALLRDRRDAAALRGRPEFTEFARFEETPVISTVSTGGPPWNNPELLRALSGALNRTWLAAELFGGRAAPGAPIDPVFGRPFALTPADLARFPGYGDPEADARDARRRWDAAGGAALGTIRIDIPSVFDPAYGASAVVTGRLAQVLGNRFVAAVEPYTTIGERAASGEYGGGRAALWFGWGPPYDDPDPSRALAANYGPALPGIRPRLDAMLTEFDVDSRAKIAREVALAVLEAGGGGVFPWLVQRQELFRARALLRALPGPFWIQHRDFEAALSS
ncbi:MAG: hypothetical protein IT302_15720 [Dehalococcoidia bacterium]|nr:hypothetical protein [Dehalococcoidia bacterium]